MYSLPLDDTLKIMKRNRKFDIHMILFYTDGEAPYPKK